MRRVALVLLVVASCSHAPSVWASLTPAQRAMNCANGRRVTNALRVSPDGETWMLPAEYQAMIAKHCTR